MNALHTLELIVRLAGVFLLFLAGTAIFTRVCYGITEKIAAAPAVDFFISLFTWIPWVIGLCCAGWRGFAAALLAQFVFLHLFCLAHRTLRGGWGKKKGKTLTDTQNKIIGVIPNQLALLAQTPAVPAFVLVRAAELTVYPVLCALAGLPRYRQSEWVNLSRHKFSGLVGYDLVWCWYCDWMTGIWSLGSEMLRNIESFWCPIQFESPKKNANASLDFPDIAKWVPNDSTTEAAARLVEEHYPGPVSNSWWGHPDRENPPNS